MKSSTTLENSLDRRQTALLCINIIFAMAGLGIIAPILPQIQDWAGASYSQIGLFVSAFAVARVVADIPAGILVDRHGGSLLTAVGMTLIMSGSLLSAAAPVFGLLITGRVIAGLGSAVAVASIQTQLLLKADADNRSQTMSYFMIARRAGASIFPLVGGILASVFNWRAVFIFSALLNVIGIIIALFSYKKEIIFGSKKHKFQKKDKVEGKGKPVNISLGLGLLFVLYFLAFALFINRNGMEKSTIPLFGSLIGLDSTQIGLMLSLSSMLSLGSILLGGRLADRYGRKLVLVLGLVAMLLANSLFLFVNNFLTFVLAGLAFGASAFTLGLPNVIASDIATPSYTGRILGGIRLFNDLGTVVGPVILAWIMEVYNFKVSVAVTMGVLAFALLLVCFLLPESAMATGKKYGSEMMVDD